jgi:fatty-acid desaturase
MYFAVCGLVFLGAYLANVLTITVGYHRALAHRSVRLHPVLRRLVIAGGPWVTGLDPKAWVVMHRQHHEHSDTPADPHSPLNVGLWGVGLAQLRSYKKAIKGLVKRDRRFTRYAKDLGFGLSPLNWRGRWLFPYALHAVIGLALGVSAGWVLGLAYFLGMVSHPVQGGMVNALGHAVGGRNFDTPDNSRNNHLAAWLICGEGFQNNHHKYPGSASFSYRRREIDLGYATCVGLEKLGLLHIRRASLIPRPAA